MSLGIPDLRPQRQVFIESAHDGVVLSQVPAAARGGLQRRTRHLAQEGHRVVAGDLPGFGVDPAERPIGAGVPGPPQVVGQIREAPQPRREVKVVLAGGRQGFHRACERLA